MRKATWLRTLPAAAPATLHGHSRAGGRFIHEITRQTWVVSRKFCGKAVRQSVEQLPWTKRQPVLDLLPQTESSTKEKWQANPKFIWKTNYIACHGDQKPSSHNHKANKGKRTTALQWSVLSWWFSHAQFLLNLASPTIPTDRGKYWHQSKSSGSRWPV